MRKTIALITASLLATPALAAPMLGRKTHSLAHKK